MKLLIASDIHGSALWCRKLLEYYRLSGADRMLLLGDLLYHGPRNDLPEEYAPKEVISLLNSAASDLFAVRGNCEAEVDQMVLDFPCMADYALLSLDKSVLFATHGHVFSPDHLPRLHPGDRLLYGHTHIPGIRITDGIQCVNPGSVSIPKAGTPHSCILLEEDRFTFVDLARFQSYVP